MVSELDFSEYSSALKDSLTQDYLSLFQDHPGLINTINRLIKKFIFLPADDIEFRGNIIYAIDRFQKHLNLPGSDDTPVDTNKTFAVMETTISLRTITIHLRWSGSRLIFPAKEDMPFVRARFHAATKNYVFPLFMKTRQFSSSGLEKWWGELTELQRAQEISIIYSDSIRD